MFINEQELTSEQLAVAMSAAPADFSFVRLPLKPGANLWYDSRCGAWGNMGGPCLGAVQPNLPFGTLSPNASGSTPTMVFINGRQLHPMDVLAITMATGACLPGRWWCDAMGNIGMEGSPFPVGNMWAAMARRASRPAHDPMYGKSSLTSSDISFLLSN